MLYCLLLLLVPPCWSLGLMTKEPPPPRAMSRNDPVEGWVDVRVNHFDASNTDTFPMRYYYNSEFSDPSQTDNDLVIFVGGEWMISPGWVTSGLAYQLAEEIGAGLFYTEHRYYGRTRPVNDTETTSLRYLTVDQALGDLAEFIHHVTSDTYNGDGRYRNGSVILVGCSYSASMVTWMKLAYPHLVGSGFSDSGPIVAQEDFPEYLEMISTALREQGSEQCVTVIQDAMEQLTSMLETQDGAQTVSNMFNTCTPLVSTSPLDVATFSWFGITEMFAYLVQYATPGDIPAACQFFTNDSETVEPVQRLANFVGSMIYSDPCIETRYSEVVAKYTETSFDSIYTTMRLWTYQTCVEFGWYQTTTGANHPFLNSVPLEYFHQMCKDLFGEYFDENLVRSGVERTNIMFGGQLHLPDNVVSVAGGHDPWAPMAANQTHARPLAPVYVVPQASHCRAIQPLGSSDTEELEAIKQAVFAHMYEFATGEPLPSSSQAVFVSLTALLACVMASMV